MGLLVIFLAFVGLVCGLGFPVLNVANGDVKITADKVKMNSCVCFCRCSQVSGVPEKAEETPISQIVFNVGFALAAFGASAYMAKKAIRISNPTYKL
jgi:hypothetical protein